MNRVSRDVLSPLEVSAISCRARAEARIWEGRYKNSLVVVRLHVFDQAEGGQKLGCPSQPRRLTLAPSSSLGLLTRLQLPGMLWADTEG